MKEKLFIGTGSDSSDDEDNYERRKAAKARKRSGRVEMKIFLPRGQEGNDSRRLGRGERSKRTESSVLRQKQRKEMRLSLYPGRAGSNWQFEPQ